MISNDVIAEAISGLATSIRLLNWSRPVSESAARVEGILQAAQLRNLREEINSALAGVSASATSAPVVQPASASNQLNIDVDTTQLLETLVLLEQLTPAALAAEAALAKLWSIQEAMQCCQASNGSGGACSPTGSASESASRTAALNELGEQSGAIGIRVINEASAVAGQKESRQTD